MYKRIFESLCYIDCDSGKYLQFVTEGMKELILMKMNLIIKMP